MLERSPARSLVVCALLLLSVALGGATHAAGRGEPGPILRVHIPVAGDDAALLATLHAMDIDVDGAFHDHVRAFVVREELDKLAALGIEARVAPEPAPGTLGQPRAGVDEIPAEYRTYETLTSGLQQIAADHPDLARLTSIGTSVQGRELWVMKLTANPDVEEDEPEFLYVAAMHGDEVVGKEMVYHLIDHLTDGYGTDARATAILDGTELWILPSMNPDGTALARRYNANWVDLNRDFPDVHVDPVNTPDGRQPETGALMTWAAGRNIALSANFHGGALVANYPFDGNPSGASVYTATPDDDLFLSLARTYADANPALASSNGHPSYDHGVCNGADWYAINGGLQDWSWIWRGDANLTLEISQIKWPSATTLPGYWDDNLESMLAYIERVRDGARGTVVDADDGTPVAAEVRIDDNPYPSYVDPDVGDWHRAMVPGTYDLEVSAVGYATELVRDVVVPPSGAVRIDVALRPLATDLEAVAACADASGTCDPWLVPGASSDVTVTARNTGDDATAVTGTLESIGWFADVDRAAAAYPDLAPGDEGDSADPGHGVAVAPDAPVGHKAGFVLRWQAAQGSGTSEPFFVPVGVRSCATVDGTGLPLAVLDRATTDDTVTVVDDLEIDAVEVAVDVRHTYRSDLRIELVSPAGTRVTLHARSGGSADDVVGTYGADLVPFETLARLRGESSAGEWTLSVHDGVPANTGTLEAWSLTACGRAFEAATPEMRFRSLERTPEGVDLAWWPYPGITEYRVYRSTDPSVPGSFVDVSASDPDPTDTVFSDPAAGEALYWLVSGVGPRGEGPRGHSGQ